MKNKCLTLKDKIKITHIADENIDRKTTRALKYWIPKITLSIILKNRIKINAIEKDK